MIFSERELLCFNSLIDGKTILGTHFKAQQNPSEGYLQQTVNSLKKKGLLDTEDNPNVLFILAVQMLKSYKKAKNHLFINKARIALEDSKVTVLTEMENGYDLMHTDKILFFQGLIQEIPFLLGADKGIVARQSIKPDLWSGSIQDDCILYDNMWMHKFMGGQLAQTQIMYRIENQGYIYSPDQEELTACGPREMRAMLLNLFEIKKAG